MKSTSVNVRITTSLKEYLQGLVEKYYKEEEIESVSDVVRMIITKFKESEYGRL